MWIARSMSLVNTVACKPQSVSRAIRSAISNQYRVRSHGIDHSDSDQRGALRGEVHH